MMRLIVAASQGKVKSSSDPAARNPACMKQGQVIRRPLSDTCPAKRPRLRFGARGLREGWELLAEVEGPVVPAYGMNAACSIAWIAA